MQVIKEGLSPVFFEETFAADGDWGKEADDPKEGVPGGFVEAAFKTEGTHKHGGGYVYQHGTQGAFLPELEEEFFFNELPHGP